MHSDIGGGHRAKCDDDDVNIFRGIACEGHIHRHTDRHTLALSIVNFFKVVSYFKKNQKTSNDPTSHGAAKRSTSRSRKEERSEDKHYVSEVGQIRHSASPEQEEL